MPIQVFRLRGVPEDEADEVRELLQAHRLDFYETRDRGWGVSMPAIWVREEAQANEAKRLIDAYQVERAERMRALYLQQVGSGEAPATPWAAFKRHPIRTLIYLLIVVLVLFFSVRPFFL